jgi:hypothetical protein
MSFHGQLRRIDLHNSNFNEQQACQKHGPLDLVIIGIVSSTYHPPSSQQKWLD